MKLYFFLCLLLLPLWTNATVQINANVDIASQLYVASYTVTQSGTYSVSGNCGEGPWSDSMGYALSESYAGGTNLGFNGTSQGAYVGPWQCMPCGGARVPFGPPPPPIISDIQSTIEDGTGLILNNTLVGDTIIGTTTAGTNVDNFTNTDVGLQWGWENGSCNVTVPVQGGSENISRTVVTILKLRTGGGARSKLQNLFGMNASIQQVAPMIPGMCGLPPDPASICGGTDLTNGPVSIQTNWSKIFPDNANVVVTPQIVGLNDYTFNLTPTKYHCYLDLYVYQPYPDTIYAVSPINITDWQLLGEGGHAMWSFETEIPTNALSFLPTSEMNLLRSYNDGGPLGTVPGIPCGFWPNQAVTNSGYFGIYPGEVHIPDNDIQDANMMRRFYISYPGFLQGLSYTIELYNYPPEYSFFLPDGNGNCVNQTCLMAYQSGVPDDFWWPALPPQVAPQNFGANLYLMYPGPWISDIPYYPKKYPWSQ